MKIGIMLLLVLLFSTRSIYALSEPIEAKQQQKQTTHVLPNELIQLALKISAIKILPIERNQRLRIERAQYYYLSAQQFFTDNWEKKAMEKANRGLVLLAMNEV
jgi:biopolymer transport protein ExbB/TolQ